MRCSRWSRNRFRLASNHKYFMTVTVNEITYLLPKYVVKFPFRSIDSVGPRPLYILTSARIIRIFNELYNTSLEK